jgi:hypothetical protein
MIERFQGESNVTRHDVTWVVVSESSQTSDFKIKDLGLNVYSRSIIKDESDLVQTSKEGLAAIFESYRLSGGNRE